jgi:hypothetical protein
VKYINTNMKCKMILWIFLLTISRFTVRAAYAPSGDTCDPGYWLHVTGFTLTPYICLDCPAGYRSPGGGWTSCEKCSAGQYSKLGSSDCTECAVGMTSPAGDNNCDECSRGKYQDQKGQGTCKLCLDGTYGPWLRQDSVEDCKACPEGRANPGGNSGTDYDTSEDCEQCVAGQYQDATGQVSCKFCDPGRYANVAEQKTCVYCPAGKYSLQTGASSEASCKNCPVGWYQSIIGSVECIPCEKGRFNNVEGDIGTVNWYPKGVGGYQPPYGTEGRGQAKCGTWWSAFCPAGTYQDQTGQTECKKCPPGKFSTEKEAATNTCKICPSGTYSSAAAASACISCPAGRYSPPQENVSSEADCLYCPVGKYQSQSGKNECISCHTQKVTGVLTGATGCNIVCSNGYLSEGRANCEKCPDGEYLNYDNGDSTCKQCSAQLPISDGTSCYRCLPGRHRGSCAACPVGRYTGWENEILDECRLCETGYQDEEGRGNCKTCPAGRISTVDRTTCVTCPLGEYSDAENLIECKTCSTAGEQHTGIIGQKIAVCTTENTKGIHTVSTTGLGVDPALTSGTKYGYQATLNDVVMNGHDTFTTTCGANKYKNTFVDGSCKDCPAGLYKEADPFGLKIVGPNDFNVCKFCPAGESYSSGGCMKCPEILLSHWSSQPQPPHNVNRFALSNFPRELCSLDNCPAGSFAQNAECYECPAGTYWESKPVRGIPYDGSMDYSILHNCDQMETQFHVNNFFVWTNGKAISTAAQRTSIKEQCEQCYTNPSTTLIDMGPSFCSGTTHFRGNYNSDEVKIYANGAENPGNTLEEERDACKEACWNFQPATPPNVVNFDHAAGFVVNGFVIWVQEGSNRGKCYCAVNTDLSRCTISEVDSAKYRTYSFSSAGCQAGKDLRASTTTYVGLCRSCPVGQYQDATGQVACKSCSTATTRSATSC